MSIDDATPNDWDALGKDWHNLGKKKKAKEDVVNNPSHYNTGSVECIDAIEESMSAEAFQGYLKGNTLKYLWRYSYKSKPLQDLQKAEWYLNRLIKTVEK